MDNYYGFQLNGKEFIGGRKLVQTFLPVGQMEMEGLISEIKDYAVSCDFPVVYGFVKELLVSNREIKMNNPSKVGTEKLQAFIIKRDGQTITNNDGSYFIDGERIEFDGFRRYEISIIEVD